MTGYQSKRLVTNRYADPVTVDHIIQLRKENARYQDALQKIADGDIDRASAVKWREDGQYSTNDKCEHGLFMFEDCGKCIGNFARAALKEGE